MKPVQMLRNFRIYEVYLTREKTFLARQKKMEWSRNLDLDSLISANCWASLEEMEKVIAYHIDEFKYVAEMHCMKCLYRASHCNQICGSFLVSSCKKCKTNDFPTFDCVNV